MDKHKRAALEARGIKVTDSPAEMLGLSQDQMDMIDLKINLGLLVRKLRAEQNWSQADLAELMATKQPAIALLERGSPKVSLERFMLAVRLLGSTIDLQFEGKSLLSATG